MKEYLSAVFSTASKKLEYLADTELDFEIPKQESHGDLSVNAALLLSKKLKKNPRVIAEEILNYLEFDKSIIEKTEIAGPGFINFYFSQSYKALIVKQIIEQGENFGKSDKFKNLKASVEFVSANPTGPLTVGHGRNAVIGDTIANLLEWIGYKVDREYYFNNAGRQMRVLGDSIRLRYLELLGEKNNFPEDYYQGEYIREIAEKLYDEHGDKLKNEDPEGIFKQKAEQEIFSDIKRSLLRLNIKHDIFYNENTLYDEKKIDKVLAEFRKRNLSYEKDGALWLKLTEMGGEVDKVIIKSTTEPTYRLPDIAYHITKFERNYNLMVDIFGSDHTATYPDVMAGIKSLGFDVNKIKVLIHQFVTIMDEGEVVKMSTRKANYITLDELIDEVGSDVVRYFFNMRNLSSHMNFDLNLAKKQSDENPVFYLQYAHARICSIERNVISENLSPSVKDLHLLNSDEEILLLKKLNQFKDEVLLCAEQFEAHRLCGYLEELAGLFHRFYRFKRILGEEKKLAEARLVLISAVRTVLKNGLAILGVTAPEKM